MRETRAVLPAACLLGLTLLLGGCGQKGPLYLPDAQGEVVGTEAPAPEAGSAGANSPRTVDSPPAPPSPAPEVTAPEGQPEQDEAQEDGKNTPGAPPPR